MRKGVQIPLHPVIEIRKSSGARVKGAPERVYWSEAETLDAGDAEGPESPPFQLSAAGCLLEASPSAQGTGREAPCVAPAGWSVVSCP